MILIILYFLLAIPAFAGNNISITCTENSCKESSEIPFFSEQNMAPGFSKTQTITVVNNRGDTCNLQFILKNNSARNLLSSKETISLVADSTVWYTGTLDNLSDNKYHQLGHIDSNQSKNYSWTVSLDKSLGNEYRLQTNNFDVDFNFTCEDTINNKSNYDNQECRDIPPQKVPQNLKVISGENMITLFWDQPDDNFTYYLISFSENSNATAFGDPNIGPKGTVSYAIKNLSGGTKYFFKIRTGNGCAPGAFSDIVWAIPKGKAINNFSTNVLFQKDVLGVSDTSPEISEKTSDISCIKIFPYAFLLALLLNLVIYRYPVIVCFVSILSLMFDLYLSKFTCQKYPYFYLGNSISFIVPLIVFLLKRSKKSSKSNIPDKL